MNKKYFLFGFFIIAGIAFVFVSFMVSINKGKSKRWILYKMKIGALLLTFTAVSVGCRVRHGTCYKMIPRQDTQEAVVGVSAGGSGVDLKNNYYSINAGIGPERFPPEKFGHELGISFTKNKYSDNINYTLGPYYSGFYRIGYLTDLFVESSYNLSMNKSKQGNNLVFKTGISYPRYIISPLGVCFFGNFTYSFGNDNLSFYPSVKLYVSLNTNLKTRTRVKQTKQENTDQKSE